MKCRFEQNYNLNSSLILCIGYVCLYVKKKMKRFLLSEKKKKLLLQDFTSAFDIHPCSKYVKPVLLI